MAEYTVASSGDGPKVKDLVDDLVAICVVEKGNAETERGVRYRVIGDTYKLDTVEMTTEHVGKVRFYQDVLRDELDKKKPGGWVVSRIIQPNRAYLFKAPLENELDAIAKLMEHIDDVADEEYDDSDCDVAEDDDEQQAF